jgi:hypothetical protein
MINYMVSPVKTGADTTLNFTSVEEATAALKAKLNAQKAGSGNTLLLLEIGTITETYGGAIIFGYEKTNTGITVYLKNEVKSVDGKYITTMNWNPTPLLPFVPMMNYMVSPIKAASDVPMQFGSVEEARQVLQSRLSEISGASGLNVVFGEIGVMFEVTGSSILVAYERTAAGITVYLKSEIRTVDGRLIATLDWSNWAYGVNH